MPTISNVFCAKCKRFMEAEKNGVTVEEMMEGNRPYKLWKADLYQCPKCGNEIITGFASDAFAEHFQEDYQQQKVREVNNKGTYFYQENI